MGQKQSFGLAQIMISHLCKVDRIFKLGDVAKRALSLKQWGPTR